MGWFNHQPAKQRTKQANRFFAKKLTLQGTLLGLAKFFHQMAHDRCEFGDLSWGKLYAIGWACHVLGKEVVIYWMNDEKGSWYQKKVMILFGVRYFQCLLSTEH